MYNIPLYNCYWCKCAWCVFGGYCKDQKCYLCRQIDKKGKVPYIKENCKNFIPDTYDNRKLLNMVQQCDSCKYKRFYYDIKRSVESG